MFSSTDLYSSASKSYLESQLALITALTEITYKGTAQFLELELQATKGTMAETALASKKLSDVKNVHEWVEFVTAFSQINAIRSLEFTRHAAKIGAQTLHAWQEVIDKELQHNSKKVKELVEDAAKHAPGSTPQSVAFVKSLFDATNTGYSHLAKATQETVEALEANLLSATNQVAKSLEETIEHAGHAKATESKKTAEAKKY